MPGARACARTCAGHARRAPCHGSRKARPSACAEASMRCRCAAPRSLHRVLTAPRPPHPGTPPPGPLSGCAWTPSNQAPRSAQQVLGVGGGREATAAQKGTHTWILSSLVLRPVQRVRCTSRKGHTLGTYTHSLSHTCTRTHAHMHACTLHASTHACTHAPATLHTAAATFGHLQTFAHLSVYMVHWDVKVAHALTAVDVHGQHPAQVGVRLNEWRACVEGRRGNRPPV